MPITWQIKCAVIKKKNKQIAKTEMGKNKKSEEPLD